MYSKARDNVLSSFTFGSRSFGHQKSAMKTILSPPSVTMPEGMLIFFSNCALLSAVKLATQVSFAKTDMGFPAKAPGTNIFAVNSYSFPGDMLKYKTGSLLSFPAHRKLPSEGHQPYFRAWFSCWVPAISILPSSRYVMSKILEEPKLFDCLFVVWGESKIMGFGGKLEDSKLFDCWFILCGQSKISDDCSFVSWKTDGWAKSSGGG